MREILLWLLSTGLLVLRASILRLLQSATDISKCDNFITKCDDYYKVRQNKGFFLSVSHFKKLSKYC